MASLASLRDLARAALPSAGPYVIRSCRGALQGSAEPLSLLYCGEQRFAREFSFLWSKAPEVSCETRMSGNLLRYAVAPDAAVGQSLETDVVLRQLLPVAQPRKGELLHYPFLDATLALASSLDAQIAAVRSKAQRRLMRKLRRRREYTFRVSNDAADFGLFYESMYRPYVTAKFGGTAHLDGRADLLRLFTRAGRLLLVSREGRPVCGALLFPRSTVLCYHRNGFLEGAQAPPRVLAERTAALELALFEHAIQSGFRSIDLGFTRAVLSDGLFVHKRRLGCSFDASRDSPRFAVGIRPAFRPRLLSVFPLLSDGRARPVAHLGYPGGQPALGPRRWKRVVKNYSFPGLAEAILHTDAAASDPGRVDFELALRRALRTVPLGIVEVPRS